MNTRIRNKLLGLLAQNTTNSKLDTVANWKALASELHVALETNLIFAEGYVLCLTKLDKQRGLKGSPATKEVKSMVKADQRAFIAPYLAAEHKKANPRILTKFG